MKFVQIDLHYGSTNEVELSLRDLIMNRLSLSLVNRAPNYKFKDRNFKIYELVYLGLAKKYVK